jgi:hypothetical protein
VLTPPWSSVTRSWKRSVVCTETNGAVKLAAAVFAPLRVTLEPEVWVQV